MGLLDLVRPYKDREEEISDEFIYDIEIDDSDVQSIRKIRE